MYFYTEQAFPCALLPDNSSYRGLFRSDRLPHRLHRIYNLHLLIISHVTFRHKFPYPFSGTAIPLLLSDHYMLLHSVRIKYIGSCHGHIMDFPFHMQILLLVYAFLLQTHPCTGSDFAAHSFHISDRWNNPPDVLPKLIPSQHFANAESLHLS